MLYTNKMILLSSINSKLQMKWKRKANNQKPTQLRALFQMLKFSR